MAEGLYARSLRRLFPRSRERPRVNHAYPPRRFKIKTANFCDLRQSKNPHRALHPRFADQAKLARVISPSPLIKSARISGSPHLSSA
jgi:hypothetical protein